MTDRPEPRLATDLSVRVFGMGTDGHAFSQNARARNISQQGALLSGLEHPLAVGDVIGVQYDSRKARFRVVWVIDAGAIQKLQVGIEMMDGQQSPWRAELEAVAASPAQKAGGGQEHRKFVRYKIRLPIELQQEHSRGPAMKTNATDISGRGCYVETFLPLPKGTIVNISFWAENENIHSSAVVRASDPGVGMGIEFVGLDEATQVRIQSVLEKMNPSVSGLSGLPRKS